MLDLGSLSFFACLEPKGPVANRLELVLVKLAYFFPAKSFEGLREGPEAGSSCF